MQIWDAIENMLHVPPTAVRDIVQASARQMGFDNVGFAARAERLCAPQDASGVLSWHSYRNGWAASYQKLHQDSAAHTDARVLASKLNLPPAAWNTLGEINMPILATLIPDAKRQIGVAGEFGMRGGITLPLQSRHMAWGFFTFSTDSTYQLRAFQACLADAMLLASVAAIRMWPAAPMAALPDAVLGCDTVQANPLSRREVEVLRWCAAGKTSWEISAILAISERTVNFHVGRIASRLGVRGRSAACAAAIAHGWMDIG
jgi:DNA-binding CsgD family transcriptional regulator